MAWMLDELPRFTQHIAMKLKTSLSYLDLSTFTAYRAEYLETDHGHVYRNAETITESAHSDQCQLNVIDATDETNDGVDNHDKSHIITTGVNLLSPLCNQNERGDRSIGSHKLRTKSIVNKSVREYSYLTTLSQRDKITHLAPSDINTDVIHESVDCQTQQTDARLSSTSTLFSGKVLL